MITIKRLAIFTLAILAVLPGCKTKPTVQKPVGPDYTHQLGPGQSALRLITDPNRMPDIAGAYRDHDVYLLDALDQSLSWFAAPSSKQFFPFETFTHEQARVSLLAFRQLLQSATDEASFTETVKEQFDVYESVGYNNEGIVLFTGYYAGVFDASKTRSDKFRFPLYKRPKDLATDPKSGEPLGRRMPDGSIKPYPTRAEIEHGNLLAGNELIWLSDPLDVYIVQVNGSAKLRLPDGKEMYVGYAGKTDRAYYGLGKSMVEAGLIDPNHLSLPAIRQVYRDKPQQVMNLIDRNESYVFFSEYPADKWPAGSLGVKVTPETTLATDKKIYPRGGVVLADTQAVTLSMGKKRFRRFMLDQDTGGAIRAPGRADIFMGIGSTAEIFAGGQYAEGRLYYFFLKPKYLAQYADSRG